MDEKGSNHQHLKRNNYHLIKKYIYQHSPISRVEVAHKLSLTTPTITGMVTPLITRGLLQEISTDTDGGKGAGRPRVMLEFVPDAYYICGVDVGPYRINYVLTDLHGNVICWSTGGKNGFKGSRKSTAYAAQVIAGEAAKKAQLLGLKEVEVRIKGPGAGRESAVRGIAAAGLEVTVIKDTTPVPHNGCRPPKRRRV